MEYLNKITDEDVKLLPKIGFEGEVELISDYEGQVQAAQFLMQYGVIGFDTESRASFKKGVVNKIALVQLSAGGRAFLIRVNKVKLDSSIIKLLESSEHLKIGVALNEDVRELQTVTPFNPQGFIDLQRIVGDYSIAELGLKKMCAIVLKIQISKAQRLSNWEATQLTESQIRYAATDAWVCEEIFRELSPSKDLIAKGTVKVKSRSQQQYEKYLKAKARREKYKEIKKAEAQNQDATPHH